MFEKASIRDHGRASNRTFGRECPEETPRREVARVPPVPPVPTVNVNTNPIEGVVELVPNMSATRRAVVKQMLATLSDAQLREMVTLIMFEMSQRANM